MHQVCHDTIGPIIATPSFPEFLHHIRHVDIHLMEGLTARFLQMRS
jgi:hypothetical protein